MPRGYSGGAEKGSATFIGLDPCLQSFLRALELIGYAETAQIRQTVRSRTWILLEFNVQRLELAGTLISTHSHQSKTATILLLFLISGD